MSKDLTVIFECATCNKGMSRKFDELDGPFCDECPGECEDTLPVDFDCNCAAEPWESGPVPDGEENEDRIFLFLRHKDYVPGTIFLMHWMDSYWEDTASCLERPNPCKHARINIPNIEECEK